MSGFNFGQIGNIMAELFDSDYIDIKRNKGNILQEVYSNVSCHLSFTQTDNPDPNSVDITPIIQSMYINLPTWVDIQNNDYIIAKRMDSNGNLLKVYSGRCGNPTMSQGRQKVLMTMSSTKAEEATPVPPKNPVRIKIEYISGDISIQDSIEELVEIGSAFSITAPLIEGYQFSECYLDDVKQEFSTIYVPNINDSEHTIIFMYNVATLPNTARLLINGLYTTDSGNLVNGYHFYKKINLNSISESNGVYIITCDNIDWVHDDNGKQLSIVVGTKMILIPGNIFVEVESIVNTMDNEITFKVIKFTPTDDEKNAYITGWYD